MKEKEGVISGKVITELLEVLVSEGSMGITDTEFEKLLSPARLLADTT